MTSVPSKSPTYYEEKLAENAIQLELLLERLKKSYPLHKGNPNSAEYKSMYDNDTTQIQSIFSQLSSLENQIMKASLQLSNKMSSDDSMIKRDKKLYNTNKPKLDSILSGNQASVPREKEYQEFLNDQYIQLGINMAGIGVGGYLLYKVFK
jgi:hypothetical protein